MNYWQGSKPGEGKAGPERPAEASRELGAPNARFGMLPSPGSLNMVNVNPPN